MTAQVFRYSEHAFGIEFHPEMTRAMIERWTGSERGGAMLSLRGAPAARGLSSRATTGTAPVTDRWLDAVPDEHRLLREAGALAVTRAERASARTGAPGAATSSRACDQPFAHCWWAQSSP